MLPLLTWLIQNHPAIKKTRLKQLLKHGSVTVNGKPVTRHDHPVKPGDKVGFLSKVQSVENQIRKHLSFPILFEDDTLLVIDKPAGLLTMGTEKDKIHTAYFELTDYCRTKSPDKRGRVFIVHRLDQDVSGLVLFSKNPAAKEALQEHWQDVVKKYYAIVEGTPRQKIGKLESYLVEDKFRRVYSTNERTRGAKRAVTLYRTLKSDGHHSLLEITLVTGRKNQIRVQLADLGHPVIGDAKYGSASDPAGRLGLHAFLLTFKNPKTGKTQTVESPLPENLAGIIS